jgi:microsomal epoxide hydrolase
MADARRPYQIAVPQQKLDQIRAKLEAATITYAPDDDSGWRYGADAAYLKSFIEHWLAQYDWRAAEERLNAVSQFKAKVDGIDIHFQHIKGMGPNPMPLVLTHGWPGSIYEFHKVIGPLSDPSRFGGDPHDAFELVVPSLPGYGFSSRPDRPIGPRRTAELWKKLMTEALGYRRYGIQGGDWGSSVSSWLAADAPQHAIGVHINLCMLPTPSPNPNEDELAWIRKREAVRAREAAYQLEHATKPQTIGIALTDSPAGFAGWVLEKFQSWADTKGDIESRFSKDELITNLMIYLVNDAVASSTWLYYGRQQETMSGKAGAFHTAVPTGCALYPAEMFPWPPRKVVERFYNVVHWAEMKAGGHFAAFEEPEALVEDLRTFFRPLRTAA